MLRPSRSRPSSQSARTAAPARVCSSISNGTATTARSIPRRCCTCRASSTERRALEKRQGLGAEAIAGNVWSSIGPTNGAGRATAIALHASLPNTAIIGAAGGGAWKTTNSGVTWTPLTETLPNLSVGAIAYAPSDANRVYLGTGEGGYAADFIPGIGLLTSDDGGTSWNLPFSVLASMFYRINVHPNNANELIVGTNRGALRSTAGANGPWSTVIPSVPGPGVGYGDVTDIVRDPSNASILYAATWDRNRWCARNDCVTSNFAPPTVLKSVDGGATWAPAAGGLPVSTASVRVERISIAIAPSSPGTLFALTALFDADSGTTFSHVYKTTDGGGSWSETGLVSSSDSRVYNLLSTQGWYDNTIVVVAGDADTVLAGGVQYARTTDGGATWTFRSTARRALDVTTCGTTPPACSGSPTTAASGHPPTTLRVRPAAAGIL